MTISHYLLYLLLASLTIASPGPGVVLTLANTLKYGLKKSLYGIAGIALSMCFIAILASSGLGALLVALPNVFNALKIIGALYLFYLAWKLWNSQAEQLDKMENSKNISDKSLFKEAFMLTLSNPKALVFFTALFPQFINTVDRSYDQFVILIGTFCLLIVIIHFFYAISVSYVSKLFTKGQGMSFVNKFSSIMFTVFSVLLFKNAIESYQFNKSV